VSIQQDFISSMLPGATSVQIETGLPGAVLIAQAALETGWGGAITRDLNSHVSSNNLFNIKGSYQGQSVQAWTTEYINGIPKKMIQTFRKYPNFKESFADYAQLITGNPAYARAVAVKDNPWQYANMLQACGYATDPTYAMELSALMKQWNLVERVNKLADEIANTPSGWAKAAWEKCVEAGIFDGTKPHDSMTREMLAVILVKLGLVK
jgi:flagellar rod assembly protein/muramidase FlgJ